jgi:hypothetical protein
MAPSYDGAVEALYRGPLDAFVAERKRLASELKAGGDKEAAARLIKLGRPSISAWVVNQLFWHDRDAFDKLLATAARLRRGEHDAGAEHQRALSALRQLAASRLASAGHAAPESTLRRVTTTLSAVAVAGGFDPDPAGALVADRDPPGFDALALSTSTSAPQRDEAMDRDKSAREQAKLERERAEQEQKRLAEQRRRDEERARKRAERERLEAAVIAAQAEAAGHQRDAERLRRELNAAENKLEKSMAALARLKEALEALEA